MLGKRPYNFWTEEKEQFLVDTYSSLTAKEQAQELGKPYDTVVMKRIQMAKNNRFRSMRRAYLPQWTPDEEEWLRQNYPRLTLKALSSHLNRSETAILLKKKRLNITRSSEDYTATALAEIFGCDSKAFTALVNEGFLEGKKLPYLAKSRRHKKYRSWGFTEDQVVTFLRTYPWLVNVKKMQQPHYFRSVILEEWDANPWLNTKQAAALVGIQKEALMRRFRRGEIPAFQRSPGKKWSYWLVRKNELLTNFKRRR